MAPLLIIQVHNVCVEVDTCALIVDPENWMTVAEAEEIVLYNTGVAGTKTLYFGVEHSGGVGDFCRNLYTHKQCNQGEWFKISGVPVFFMWRKKEDGYPPDEMHPSRTGNTPP